MATTNAAVTNYVRIIEKTTELLKSDPATAIPIEEWELTYRELRGISGWFDSNNWEVIIKELPNEKEFIQKARRDSGFKRYFKLRREADRLEAMAI